MYKKMGKFVFSGTLFVTVLLTGCGGEYAGVNRAVSEGAVSGSAVSGSAVSGGAVKETSKEEDVAEKQKTAKKETKKYRYSTDKNLYYESPDSDAIIQVRRDGTQKKEILRAGEKDRFFMLEYVDENWLYYIISDDKGDTDTLCRIPLEKDANGYDVVKKSEKEELFRDSFYSFCWDSRYLVYDNDEEIVKYDLLKKKVFSRQKVEGINHLPEDTLWDFFRLPDCFVAAGDEDGLLYVQDIEGTDWKSCGNKQWKKSDFGDIVQTENCVFYEAEQSGGSDLDDWSIWKCDGRKVESFVTRDQLKQAVEKVRGKGTADEVDMMNNGNLYGDSDRLYLQVGVNWEDGSVYRMEYLIFSQGEEENELRYEKELTECMQSHVKSRTGKWASYDEEKKDKMGTVYKENVVVNNAQCVCILGGNAYLSLYDYEKDKGRLGCYELQSGKFRWISKGEAAYGELGCEGFYYENGDDEGIEGLDTVFQQEKYNEWLGVYRSDFLESEDAEFYETK